MVTFERNIFVLGCGGIVQCALPLLLKLIRVAPHRVTVMDFVDNRSRIQEALDQGVTFVHERITKDNYLSILPKYLAPGDLFIDLAWNVETCALLEWCHDNNIIYINTSIEEWEPYEHVKTAAPQSLTLYHRQMAISALTKTWKEKGATAIVDHGANPGLVSPFTKQALIDIAKKIIQIKPDDARIPKLKAALDANDFPLLGELTGTTVIHISERDSQITNDPKKVNEFVNTWSIEGLIEEGMAPAELGWGTHEKTLPHGAMTHASGPKNQILLASRGMDTWVRSWVPSGPIIGMVIRHGEAYGISERLTRWENNIAVYRPTVHYAYCPSDSTLNSLHELRMRNFEQQPKTRILNDDIISGKDEVGCLLMGHDFNAWWIGSSLDIKEARALAPHQNSTTLQVAISVVAAAIYAINNPQKGVCLPDDLDHNVILKIARPYLGEFISMQTDWNPLAGPNEYLVFNDSMPARENMWQFDSFRVHTEFYHTR